MKKIVIEYNLEGEIIVTLKKPHPDLCRISVTGATVTLYEKD